jgi:hypothetical protein
MQREQGGGMPGVQNHYTFLDQNPFDRTNCYRIKVVDLNGEFMYSDVVKVSEKLNSRRGVISLFVKDAMGREMLNIAVAEKTVLFTLDVHVLTKGIFPEGGKSGSQIREELILPFKPGKGKDAYSSE